MDVVEPEIDHALAGLGIVLEEGAGEQGRRKSVFRAQAVDVGRERPRRRA